MKKFELKKALKRLVELLHQQNERGDYEFAIIHANGSEKAATLKKCCLRVAYQINL